MTDSAPVETYALDPTDPKSVAGALLAIRDAGLIYPRSYWFSQHPSWWKALDGGKAPEAESQPVWFAAEVGAVLHEAERLAETRGEKGG